MKSRKRKIISFSGSLVLVFIFITLRPGYSEIHKFRGHFDTSVSEQILLYVQCRNVARGNGPTLICGMTISLHPLFFFRSMYVEPSLTTIPIQEINFGYGHFNPDTELFMHASLIDPVKFGISSPYKCPTLSWYGHVWGCNTWRHWATRLESPVEQISS